jgi:hypothetical protein
MLSLEPEIVVLRNEGVLDDAIASRLIAIERREIVSIYPELRVLTWAGVMLIVTGVGLYIARHLDDIGPLAIAAGIGGASLACYAWAFWKRSRAVSLGDDYVLLLAALLASADIGYIEHHYHLLGANWSLHFFFVAVLHAATAYYFQSRLVLSLSVAALTAWFGIERRNFETIFEAPVATAGRAFVCAAIVVVWRIVDKSLRPSTTFSSLFDHFATNLAFWGALTLAVHRETRFLGCAIALALAVAAMAHGWKTKQGAFVIYAWVYGMVALDIAVCNLLGDYALVVLYLLVSTVAAIVGLFVSHARLRSAS